MPQTGQVFGHNLREDLYDVAFSLEMCTCVPQRFDKSDMFELKLLLLLSLPSQRHDAQLQVSSPEGSDTQHKSGTP